MSVVSVQRAAARRCCCVSAAACAPAASASGAAGKAGCGDALSFISDSLEREGCIQAASDFVKDMWPAKSKDLDVSHVSQSLQGSDFRASSQ